MFKEYKKRKTANRFKNHVMLNRTKLALNIIKDIGSFGRKEFLEQFEPEVIDKLVVDIVKTENVYDIEFLANVIYKFRTYPSQQLNEVGEKHIRYIYNNVSLDILKSVVRGDVYGIEYYLYSDNSYNLIEAMSKNDRHNDFYMSVPFTQDLKITDKILKRLKKDFVAIDQLLGFWNSFIHVDVMHDKVIELISKDEFKSILGKNSLTWDDSIVDYVKNDMGNILTYICVFHKSEFVYKIINLIDKINCDNIKEYNLVLKIASCQSNAVLVDTLAKTSLSIEEKREILLKNNNSCSTQVDGPGILTWG